MFARAAAILISLALAAAVESRAPLAADHARAAQITRRFSDVVRRLRAAADKALVHKARQALPPPARRLAGADAPQCLWAAGACEPSDAFAESVLPATGALRDAWTEYKACEAHGSEGACLAASCAWASSVCEPGATSERMQGLLSSLLDVTSAGCGSAAGLLEAPAACSSYDAGGAQCSAANGCTTQSGFEPGNGTCEALEQCVMDENEFPSIICGAGFTPRDATACAREFSGSLDPASGTTTTPSLEAVQNYIAECMYGGCPVLRDWGLDIVRMTATCEALTDDTTCSASANCAWNSSSVACEVKAQAFINSLIPDGCGAKHLYDAVFRCEGLPQDACTGDCEWDTEAKCDGAALTEEGQCSLSVVAGMHALGLAGSPDAGAVANMMRVAEKCHSVTSETECAAASVTWVRYEETDSSSQRLVGVPTVLSLLVLGMVAILEM